MERTGAGKVMDWLVCTFFPWLWSSWFWAIFPLAEEECWPKAFFVFGWRDASDNVGHPCSFTPFSKNLLTVFQVLLKVLEVRQRIASHILLWSSQWLRFDVCWGLQLFHPTLNRIHQSGGEKEESAGAGLLWQKVSIIIEITYNLTASLCDAIDKSQDIFHCPT